MPTPRKGETREEMNDRRRWQSVKQTVNADGIVTSHTDAPERAPYAPLSDATLARRSTLVDAEGNVIQSWQIERREAAAQEAAWRAIAEELKQGIPAIPAIALPTDSLTDGLACYPIGDHHFGMYAYAPETGTDYDLIIATEAIQQACARLVCLVPQCTQALVAVLGDWHHYDSMKPETPMHHNTLDADSRAGKMIRAALRAAVYVIEAAAARHGQVHVIIEGGNHDTYSCLYLAEALDLRYENNPRITVDTSPANCHYYEFGSTLIGTNHGDKIKPEKLPLLMAQDQTEAWGRTKFRYWWTGHVHNASQRDFQGVSVESFRVLAGTDAYAATNGYRSIQDMKALVIHREFGEVARFTVNPRMWRA